MKTVQRILFLTALLALNLAAVARAAWVIQEDGRACIKDGNGEVWDVTQAEQLGFEPQKFQYGIGRDAFVPLDDQDLSKDRPGSSDTRVIGISLDGEAHASTVSRLSRHEIANTTIAGRPITVGN